MGDFMQDIYVYLWAILAVITFIVGVKQKAAYGFVVSAFFVFMAVWYGLRSFANIPVFDGVSGIVFRCIAVAFLAVCLIMYLRGRKKE